MDSKIMEEGPRTRRKDSEITKRENSTTTRRGMGRPRPKRSSSCWYKNSKTKGRKAQRTIGRKTCKIVNEIGRKGKRELYTTFHNVWDCQGLKIELMGQIFEDRKYKERKSK